jgi:RNA polymerase sigma factor (sigma-70 family)
MRDATPATSAPDAAFDEVRPGGDDLLGRFLQAGDGPEAEEVLARLLSSRAVPVARGVLRGRLGRRGDETEDLVGTVLVRLLSHLRKLKATGRKQEIRSFEGYVAAAAYRAYSDQLRRRHPARHRLKARLSRLLRDARFVLVSNPHGVRICGLARWRDGTHEPTTSSLRAADEEHVRSAVARHKRHSADALEAALEALGHAVPLDDLVGLLERLWEIEGAHSTRAATSADLERPQLTDPVSQLHNRISLRQLWTELRKLPAPQRLALLLGLRDSRDRSVVSLLALTGIASVDDVAAALDLAPPELARLWQGQPLDDLAIAERLGLTRQQVINLRSAARRRLARRLQT